MVSSARFYTFFLGSKPDFKIRKNEADLEILQMCHQDGLTLKNS